jgi:hypothetical protein
VRLFAGLMANDAVAAHPVHRYFAPEDALYARLDARGERLRRLFSLLEDLDHEGQPAPERTALHDLMCGGRRRSVGHPPSRVLTSVRIGSAR